MSNTDALAVIHFVLFVGGLFLLWFHGNFWLALGVFFVVWGHNLEHHTDIDWKNYWRNLYERIRKNT